MGSGGPGERSSQSVHCGSKHFGTTGPVSPTHSQKQSSLLMESRFGMAGHPGGWAISPAGSDVRGAECSVIPSVPHGWYVSERAFCWLCWLQKGYSLTPRYPSVLGRGTGILPGTCLLQKTEQSVQTKRVRNCHRGHRTRTGAALGTV